MNDQSDAFADAGLLDGGMDAGMGSGFADFSTKLEDYTDEERQLMKEVEDANDERKRALYEKLQQESEMKRERKQKAQIWLTEWKNKRDTESMSKKETN